MFAVFKKRDFSLMWTAQLISTIGSALTDLAAAILVFRVTNSALNVGLTLLVTALPTLFVGLFAGVFVDRFNRKRILLASDLLRGPLVLAIPLSLAALGPQRVVGLFAGVFVDRFNRKRILLASDLLRGLLVLAIPLSFDALGPETGM